MRAQNLLVLLGSITLMGCETIMEGSDKAGEFTANRINGACELSPASRATMRGKYTPYLKPGNTLTLMCANDGYASK